MKNIVGTNLRRYREEAEMSVAQLAEKAGLDRTTVYRIEDSGDNYSHETLMKLARTLNINAGALYADIHAKLAFGNPQAVPILSGFRVAPIVEGGARVLEWPPHAEESRRAIYTEGRFSEDAFAFMVMDDAMYPQLSRKDIVIAEPTLRPEPNDLVVAAIYRESTRTTQSLVRRYAERSAKTFELLPNDSAYAIERSADSHMTVLGTVVEQRRARNGFAWAAAAKVLPGGGGGIPFHNRSPAFSGGGIRGKKPIKPSKPPP